MAGQPKTRRKTSVEDIFRGRDVTRKLWKSVPPREWLALLQEIAPQNSWRMKGQSQIEGCCPYHSEKTPSFILSVNKGLGKCFGCGKVVVDMVSLIAKLRNTSATEAIIQLNSRFQLSSLIGDHTDELAQYHRLQEAKKALAIAMNRLLVELVRDKPEHLRYCIPALKYLTVGRRVPVDQIHNLPIGVFGKPEHLKQHIPEASLHPLVDEYVAKYADNTNWGAVCFHYNDTPGTISRFKLRIPNVMKVRSCKDFDSLKEHEAKELMVKDFLPIQDPYTSDMGLYGMHFYRELVGKNDVNAYATEGEFDALAIMVGQLESGVIDFMIFGTGGSGSPDLSFLRDFGIKTIWMVPDHPSDHGDSYALSILNTKKNFTQKDALRPLNIKIFQWPVGVQGLDLDDAVKYTGYYEMVGYLYRQRNAYFLNALPWVLEKCDEEAERRISEYDHAINELSPDEKQYAVQKNNLLDERRQVMNEVLLRWFKYLHEQQDKLAFTQHYATKYGVDIGEISAVSDSMYELDTMQGVARKVADALREYFAVAYKDARESTYLWAKKKGELVELGQTDKQIFNAIAHHIGRTVTEWFDALLGENPVYLSGTDGAEPGKLDRLKRLMAKDILTHSLENYFYGEAMAHADLRTRSQGIHFEDLPDEQKRHSVIYFVNGKKVFKGRYVEDELLWEQLDGIVDGEILFKNLTKRNTWSFVEDVSDLEAANNIDLAGVYTRLKTILDGWKFENHDIICPYMAAYIMALPTMRAAGDVNITVVSGDSESGKSSLAAGLLGGTAERRNPVPPILESAVFNFDATTASMYQSMDGSSLMFILDEAEESEKHNTNHDELVKEVTRNLYMIPQGVSRSRGSQDGRTVTTYHLKMPVLMSAITPPPDPTFLSRTMMIYTVKDPGRRALEEYIYEHFTEEQITQLRHDVTIAMLPHIPEFMRHRREVRTRLLEAGSSRVKVSNRFMASIINAMTILDMVGPKAVGKRVEDLYCDLIDAYKDRLENIHGRSVRSDVIDACLYREAIKVTQDDNMTDFVSAKYLIMKGEYNLLNNNDCGVYYLPEKDWIVIVWRQAKYSVLQKTSVNHLEVSALRERATKCPAVVRDIDSEQAQMLINALALSDVRGQHEFTVVSRDYLVIHEDLKIEEDESQTGGDPSDKAPMEHQDAPHPAEDFEFADDDDDDDGEAIVTV